MAGKFILKKAGSGEYYFNLEADNEEPILRSEMYKAKILAENGIMSVRINAPFNERYERPEARNGQTLFNLRAANGQIIGTSETYSTEAARESGIVFVKANAPSAAIDDQT